MRNVRVAATVLVVAAVAAVTRPSAGATPDSITALPGAQILYARGSDLYVARADGARATLLAKRAGQAAVSPDARRIAFVRAQSIWVMNRDGSGQRRLTKGYEALSPAWSPRGDTIYFSRLFEGRDKHGGYVFAWSIHRMRPDGSDVRKLTHPTAWDHGTCHTSPAPSPSGSVIAYDDIGECDRGYDATIEAIDRTGREASLGPFAVDAGFDPAWSPDGRTLAFASVDESDLGTGTGTGIRVASADGSRARRLYRRGPASGPAFSSDGKWLAFSTDGNVWLVRSDGSALRRVLRTGVWRSDPAWLPPVG